MKFQATRGATRSRSPATPVLPRPLRVLPGGRHAKEIYAASTLITLALLVVIGGFTAGGEPPTATVAAPADPNRTYEFAATAVSTGSITGATALILIVLITGAAVVGLLFYAPPPARRDDSAPEKHDAAAAPRSANRREVCTTALIRPERRAQSSRPSSRIRRCSSTSSIGR